MAEDRAPRAGETVTYHLDESVTPELQEDTTLHEGEYMIYVPKGQRAVVRYELAL